MIVPELYHEGITYAEENFLNDEAPHLRVDKALVRRLFDLSGKRVLDFGCGMGGMTLWYARNWPCQVLGIDIDRHHIQIAKDLQARHQVDNVQFEVRNILTDPPEGPFDFIFLNDVAEHIPLPMLEEIFVAFRRLLAPRGRIFISYPPWHSPYASHVTHILGLPWCQYLPQRLLLKWIEKNNRPIVGQEEPDLLQAYKGLNRLTHRRLMKVLGKSGLVPVYRKSHSFLNNIPGLYHLNLRIWPLHFLVTKEFIVLAHPDQNTPT
ncbi:MAG: hypothetical protein KatS3mg029_0930 [Saprospiraceae bacterium]|nr:MAG: hypothetical protein KatS3mg029_0930 [Saprospiraceae bacterium]